MALSSNENIVPTKSCQARRQERATQVSSTHAGRPPKRPWEASAAARGHRAKEIGVNHHVLPCSFADFHEFGQGLGVGISHLIFAFGGIVVVSLDISSFSLCRMCLAPWEKDQAWFPEWKQYEQEANLHDSFAGEPEVPMLSCSSCVRCKKTRRKQIKRDITKRTYVYTNASGREGPTMVFFLERRSQN
eukprot:1390605-Amorphochlora_amoeboformis.AAC.1